MKYLKLYEDFQKDSINFLIKKGTHLFHSTIEEFDKPLDVSPYDKILWTTFGDSAISQTYIPKSGLSMHVNIKDLLKPTTNEHITKFQKYLGIDYKDVEISNNSVTSFKDATIFKDINDVYDEWKTRHSELYKNVEKYKEEFKRIEKLPYSKENNELVDSVLKQWTKYENELIDLKYVNVDKMKEDIVEKILDSHGYTDYNNMKIRFDKNGEILPPNESVSGTLYILEPIRDLKIYDYAKDREGDLTDLEYHKVKLFRSIEKDGYDGIRINDFAQSDDEGNFGHTSIGLFKNTLKDMKIVDKIEAKHPKLSDYREKGHYDSDEYLDYIKRKRSV